MNIQSREHADRPRQSMTIVVRRSAIVSLLLGSVLAFVNQRDAILGAGRIDPLPLALVYLTPFVVVTISQMTAFRRAAMDAVRASAMTAATESFFRTLISHGIPGRAVLTGMALGSVNSVLVLGSAFLQTDRDAVLPFALLAQAFTLPVLFGLVSQAISYRRAVRVLNPRAA